VHTPYPVDYPEVSWRVVALETPRVWRHCAACNQTCRFASSDLFRLNAQQRKVDVWLLYRCTVCDATWKCLIFTRCTPEAIGADLYARCQHNDRATAWMYAFDLRGLRRLGVRVDAAVPVGVERRVRPGASKPRGAKRLSSSFPIRARCDWTGCSPGNSG
jgi:hypothetical protein